METFNFRALLIGFMFRKKITKFLENNKIWKLQEFGIDFNIVMRGSLLKRKEITF